MSKSSELFERDSKILGDVMKLRFYPIVLKRGRGAVLTDADDKEYIDFNAGWAVANTGYGHPKIVEAVRDQTEKLSFSSLTSAAGEESVQLAEQLVQMLPGDFEKKVWFGHSGSDANELITKMAPIATGRPRIVTFVGSYHGQTMGSYAMSGHPAQSRMIGGGNVVKVPYPYCYRCPFCREKESCGLFCLSYLRDYIFNSMCEPEQTAAAVVEAMQSDGGDIVPPDGYLQGLQALCREYGILFIVDEVKTGFGRTGKWFSFSHWDLEPDAVIMGKPMASGQPLSAVVGRRELLDAGTGTHLFTTAGNPTACRAGLATIDIIEQEKLAENAQKIGGYLLSEFERMKDRYEVIGDIRGKGLMIGIELVQDRESKAPAAEMAALVAYRCFELGLLFYYAGIHSNVLEFTPPLVITMDQASQAVRILTQAIDEVLKGEINSENLGDFKGWG